MNEQAFGDFIKQTRLAAGVRLRDVAAALDVSVSYVSDVEHGNRSPFKPEHWPALASVLRIPEASITRRFCCPTCGQHVPASR